MAAKEDSDRLYRIIENLLDISCLESGRSTVELVPVSTEQVLINVMEEMRPGSWTGECPWCSICQGTSHRSLPTG